MNKEINELKILHLGMTMGALIVSVVFAAYFKPVWKNQLPIEFNTPTMVGCALAVLALGYAYVIFPKQMPQFSQGVTQDNFSDFRRLHVAKWAFLEAAVMLNVVIYHITENRLLIGLAITLLMILYLNKPKISMNGIQH